MSARSSLIGCAVIPGTSCVCCELSAHCGHVGGWVGARTCAPARMDIKARRPARRQALARNFRFDRTRFICTTSFWNVLKLGQVLVNGSSRLPTPTANEVRTTRWCRLLMFGFSNLLAQQPGGRAARLQKQARRLLPEQMENLRKLLTVRYS